MEKKETYGVTVDELMDFLKENMATKEDLKGLVTKEDLALVKHDILAYIDKKVMELKIDIRDLVKILQTQGILSKSDAEMVLKMRA